MAAPNGGPPHLAAGAARALLLLPAGIVPLAAAAIVLAANRGKLREGERRAGVLGAGLASLILLPLLRLVFRCCNR